MNRFPIHFFYQLQLIDGLHLPVDINVCQKVFNLDTGKKRKLFQLLFSG